MSSYSFSKAPALSEYKQLNLRFELNLLISFSITLMIPYTPSYTVDHYRFSKNDASKSNVTTS